MASYDFSIKAGATAPPFKVAIENENNSAVDITGQKGVAFSLWLASGFSTNPTTLVSAKAASCTDSVNGYLQYQWSVGDTSGRSDVLAYAEWRVTLSDNTVLRMPDQGYQKIFIGKAIT